ncbi:hypothetical protein [Flagellimonas sp.]|uniref:hypothetical protein n=1 Tax=Flagellimonas sp. TaxID=2058762 RepID=UPI003C7E8B81
MCFSTRQIHERKALERWLLVKSMYDDTETDLELIYFHANNHGIAILNWTYSWETFTMNLTLTIMSRKGVR